MQLPLLFILSRLGDQGPSSPLAKFRTIWVKIEGFPGVSGSKGTRTIHFKGKRNVLGFKMREQGTSLLVKGTLTISFREQWNLLLGTRGKSEILKDQENFTSISTDDFCPGLALINPLPISLERISLITTNYH